MYQPDPSSLVVVSSAGMLRRRHLQAALGGQLVLAANLSRGRTPAAAIGWGLKENTTSLRAWASSRGVPFLSVEDGFIRSIGLGQNGAEPFGFVVDGSGIYYDARSPSDLETAIAGQDDGQVDGPTEALIRRLVDLRASKYNHTWRMPGPDFPRGRVVLVVDQTRGDLSIGLGLADGDSFRRMLGAALDENPDATVLCKIHPDVIAGRRAGNLPNRLPDRCRILAEDVNPQELLARVDAVYCVTSQMGFEALLAGRPVRCFGLPFYAGWGLTRDEVSCPRRGRDRSLVQVFRAAYLDYTRYVHPISGQRVGLDAILEVIAEHRRSASADEGRIWCFGFSARKRRLVRPFLPGARLEFVGSSRRALRSGASTGDRILTWGLHRDSEARALAGDISAGVERMEDGFIRSVGLGSDLIRPRSLVVDRRGIYFDPGSPSDLEHLLATHVFSEEELIRGRSLIERLRALGITKYNSGHRVDLVDTRTPGQEAILVPGQVEDDASIQRGCRDVRTNLMLLAQARRSCPDAYLIYKPHPDVLAGNRTGEVPPEYLEEYADLVVEELDMAACLRRVDAVHTMTSLTGFEALIHGKRVHTYGIPFYAGWGLTVDAQVEPRRGRCLTLEALVVGTLVHYPRYLDASGTIFVGPETVIDELSAQRASGGSPIRLPPWKRWIRKLINGFSDFRR